MAYKVRVSGAPGLKIRTFACDSAGTADEHVFEVKLMDGEHPKFCPQCGFAVDQRSRPRPSKVSIGGSNINKAVDMTYRSLEESTKDHPNPQMRITDMKDRLREGDVAAVMPNNTVTQFMHNTAGPRGLNYGWGGGGSMIAPASTSPYPVPQNVITGAGHSALWAIQGEGGRTHTATRAMAQAQGQQNKGR